MIVDDADSFKIGINGDRSDNGKAPLLKVPADSPG